MKSNILKKIDAFAKRHLLLSSFLCLISLSVALNFYMGYALPSPLLPEGIQKVVDLAISTIIIGTIPIFVISILLYHFLKKKTPVVSNFTYYKKFFLSFIPTLPIITYFLIVITQDAITYYNKSAYFYILASLISFAYSVIFATYFSWLSKASKSKIIVQCIIIGILMVFFNRFIYEIATLGAM
jgi:hypothetical protein